MKRNRMQMSVNLDARATEIIITTSNALQKCNFRIPKNLSINYRYPRFENIFKSKY